MALYAIADLHFGKGSNKYMDVFGEPWINYMEKTINNWEKTINSDDTVLIPGDICWGKNLDEAKVDLDIINSLPGKKIMLQGNHDYWWDSLNKVSSAYPNISFLQNNFCLYENFAICGTRGWLCPWDSNFSKADKKVYKREQIRLKLSLDMAKSRGYGDKIIVAMHYPPIYNGNISGFVDVIEQYDGIEKVLYGHLHGEESISGRFEGEINGVEYNLVSADYLNFMPKRVL